MNVDHVATLRNARGGAFPDPLRAAQAALAAGADGVTAHLREDRRHIDDEDMRRLKAAIAAPLNFEMAATEQMLDIALKIKPHACCLVPEKRTERTTEGGLDVIGGHDRLLPFVDQLSRAGIRVSLFIEPSSRNPRRGGFGQGAGGGVAYRRLVQRRDAGRDGKSAKPNSKGCARRRRRRRGLASNATPDTVSTSTRRG